MLNDLIKMRINHFVPVNNCYKILIIENAYLPSYLLLNDVQGITFKNKIYTRYSSVDVGYQSLLHLIHEMVHISQIQKLGEFNFAARYGHEIVINKGYSGKMPLEKEAYRLVENIQNLFFISCRNKKIRIKNEEEKADIFLTWLDEQFTHAKA